MTEPVLEVQNVGVGVSLQDLGRRGWKRFGVPPGGAMDEYAARWANRLLENTLNAPVLELLLHGAQFRVLRRISLSMTGANASAHGMHWRAWLAEEGDIISIPVQTSGLWTYIGVGGGFAGPRWFGSVSVFPRGGLGAPLAAGEILKRPAGSDPAWPSAVGERWLDPVDQRYYETPPRFLVWMGPQWDLFPAKVRAAFFAQAWKISTTSDRTGYRLESTSLATMDAAIPSEPVLPGSIQVPPGGQPIVTMRDGPTVGGYPKLGLIDPDQLGQFAQCRPGQEVRFVLQNGTPNTTNPGSRNWNVRF